MNHRNRLRGWGWVAFKTKICWALFCSGAAQAPPPACYKLNTSRHTRESICSVRYLFSLKTWERCNYTQPSSYFSLSLEYDSAEIVTSTTPQLQMWRHLQNCWIWKESILQSLLEIVLVIMDSDVSAIDISEEGEQISFSLWKNSRAIPRCSKIPNSPAATRR